MTVEEAPQTIFESIKTQRTADTIVDRLEARILDGTFSVGDLLPSEEQLATQFGVGRRSVREALKVLEARGLVEIRMGIGTTVTRNDLDSFLSTLARNITTYYRIDKAGVNHVAELRELLELAALERLAATPNAEVIEHLAETVERQKEAQADNDFHSYQDWHFVFHFEIVDALDNPIISMLYKQVMALMRKPMEEAGRNPAVMADSIHDHEQIVEALKRGAVDDLHMLLTVHLQESITNVQSVVEESAVVNRED
jgi:GntR family transcriptional regulator, transcriptional repressor for pyruvate dehydrogenase complex